MTALSQKNIKLLFLLVLICITPPLFGEAALKVGYYNFNPMIFQNSENDPDGFFVDFLNYIAKKESWELDYIFGTWNECLEMAKQGEIDLLPCIGYTNERNVFLNFTKEYLFLDWGIIYEKPGKHNFHSIFDLEGKTIGALKKSIYTDKFLSLLQSFNIECNIILKNEYKNIFEAISKDEIDGGINTKLFGTLIEGEYNVEKTPVIFAPIKLKFAAPKNKPQMPNDTIDKYLRAEKKDKTSFYYTLYDKWTDIKTRTFTIPSWLIWLIGVGLGIIFFLILFSITLRKMNQALNKANGKLELYKNNLELIVKERTEELLKSNKNLEEMVYIASHDLQVPLVSLQGFTAEVISGSKGKLDEDGRYCLERIRSNVDRMHKLVKSLLDISRLNSKENPLERFSLKTLMEKVLADLSLVIEHNGVTINIKNKLPDLYSDFIRIETVLRNIIGNAITYNSKYIEIGFSDDWLYIKDDGIGIPPDQLQKIFRPGERLKQIKAEGVGMGLTFCQKALEKLNGQIRAESEGSNKGSTFYIKFDRIL